MDDKELIRELDAIRGWFDADGMETCSRLTAQAAASLTALAEENERLRQLLWSSREMLECAEFKDAENAQVALFVREQIAAIGVVPR